MEISTIFTVIDYKTGISYEEEIEGVGEGAIQFLRKQYPRFTKIVIEGFNINGVFSPVRINK